MVYITSLSTLNLAQMIVETPLEIPLWMLRHFILPVPDLPNHKAKQRVIAATYFKLYPYRLSMRRVVCGV